MINEQHQKLLLMLNAIRIAILAAGHPDEDVEEEGREASDTQAAAALAPPTPRNQFAPQD